MARILVIEDERDLQEVLRYNLQRSGHDVSQALSGNEGLALARAVRPDLVLLDLMLPDLSGLEVCKALKRDAATSAIPIVILTARGEEIDRVLGFELGAVDYVVKPFSVRELLLRVEARLERPARPTSDERVEFGSLRLDNAAHRLWVAGREVALTALEWRLLLTLFTRKDRVQSRAALLAEVWDIQADITTRNVDTHVKRLRDKLGVAGRYVETVRGVGYRFAKSPGEDEA